MTMMQDWDQGFVGNNPGAVCRLPGAAQVMRTIARAVRRSRTAAPQGPLAWPDAA